MRGSLYVFLGGCCYGVLSTFVKLAYGEGYTMGQVVFIQYLLGTLLILCTVLFMKNRRKHSQAAYNSPSIEPGKSNSKQRFRLIGVGAVAALTGILYYAALHYISASLAILMLFQFTWIGVLAEAILQRKWPSVEKVLALLFLIVGTVFATGVLTEGFKELNWIGLAFGFLAAVSHCGFILFSGRVAVEVDAMTRALFMNTGAIIFITVIFPPTFLFSGFAWWGLMKFGLLLGFFGPLLSTFLFMKGVPLTGTGLATILGASELPMATLMASVVLGESVSLLKWAGIVIILCGIALPEIRSRMAIANKKTIHP